jgi:hypothetical protein
MWSLTLPQVAATLAATLVGFDTVNSAGQHLVDRRIFDAVFVLILVTATIGPIMTQRYAPLMLEASAGPGRQKRRRRWAAIRARPRGGALLLCVCAAAAPAVEAAQLCAIGEHDLSEEAEWTATYGCAHGDGHFVTRLE